MAGSTTTHLYVLMQHSSSFGKEWYVSIIAHGLEDTLTKARQLRSVESAHNLHFASRHTRGQAYHPRV
jgi:uncharacterized protein (UPF0248 family)